MSFFKTAFRSTHDVIDSFDSFIAACDAIKEYEQDDKVEGTFEEDYYVILDEDGCAVEEGDVIGYEVVANDKQASWEHFYGEHALLCAETCFCEYDRKDVDAYLNKIVCSSDTCYDFDYERIACNNTKYQSDWYLVQNLERLADITRRQKYIDALGFALMRVSTPSNNGNGDYFEINVGDFKTLRAKYDLYVNDEGIDGDMTFNEIDREYDLSSFYAQAEDLEVDPCDYVRFEIVGWELDY